MAYLETQRYSMSIDYWSVEYWAFPENIQWQIFTTRCSIYKI